VSTLPLNEIIAALLKEFESANMAVEVSREHWRQVYESSPLLKEFVPPRVRIAEADVSLPVAIERIGNPRKKTASLTHLQLLRLMPASISLAEREKAVSAVISDLAKRKKHTFKNANLSKDVQSLLKRKLPTVDLKPVQEAVANLQQDFLKNPTTESETGFIYQTAELEKITPERIIRLNLKITVD